MTRTRARALGASTLVLAVVLSACTSANPDGALVAPIEADKRTTAPADTTGSGPTGASPTEAGPASPTESASVASTTEGVTLERARDIALGARSGTVVEIGRDPGDGRPVWYVDVVAADGRTSEVTVDARTGAVLEVERARDRQVPSGITLDRARDIALRTQPGALQDLGLSTERGRTIWEAVVRPAGGGTPIEIYIDARTGDVLKEEPVS